MSKRVKLEKSTQTPAEAERVYRSNYRDWVRMTLDEFQKEWSKPPKATNGGK